MSDDILKEILGFDPTTGDTVENRGNLQKVPIQEHDEHGNLLVPKEVQHDFENYVHATFSNPDVPFKLSKETLFLTTTSGDVVNRTFFSQNPAETDLRKKFREQAKATFLKRGDGKYVPSNLVLLGEGQKGKESVSIDFHARPDTDTITLNAYLQNRNLIAWFDEGTQLAELTFSDTSDDYYTSSPLHVNKNTIWEASIKGKVEQIIREDTYEIIHDRKNNGPIDIIRRRSGEDLDHIVIPWFLTDTTNNGRQIRLAEVASRFFGEYEITDPFNQPVNSDIDNFANLDPITTLHINWKRGNDEKLTLQ